MRWPALSAITFPSCRRPLSIVICRDVSCASCGQRSCIHPCSLTPGGFAAAHVIRGSEFLLTSSYSMVLVERRRSTPSLYDLFFLFCTKEDYHSETAEDVMSAI